MEPQKKSSTELNRRGLITGLGSLFLAAPVIVRASSLDGLAVLRGVPLGSSSPVYYWGETGDIYVVNPPNHHFEMFYRAVP